MMERLIDRPIPHAFILCRMKSFEESVRSLGFETDPGIFHAKLHPIAFLSFGSDPNNSLGRSSTFTLHRV